MACGLLIVLYVQDVPIHAVLFKALGLIVVEFMVITAVALLFSTFSSATFSAIFTLALYVIGHLTPDLKAFGEKMGRSRENDPGGDVLCPTEPRSLQPQRACDTSARRIDRRSVCDWSLWDSLYSIPSHPRLRHLPTAGFSLTDSEMGCSHLVNAMHGFLHHVVMSAFGCGGHMPCIFSHHPVV